MKKYIITISGKTCSGKTYLLNQLLEDESFVKLVTTTTRYPREGEVEGVDYHFIQSSLAEHYINAGKFIESNVHSNQIYGLTEYELSEKLGMDKIPCIILTPNGVELYRRIMPQRGIDVFSVFIDCPIELLVNRLAHRTLENLENSNDKLKVLETSFTRAIDVLQKESNWINQEFEWDLILTAGEENLVGQLKSFIRSL